MHASAEEIAEAELTPIRAARGMHTYRYYDMRICRRTQRIVKVGRILQISGGEKNGLHLGHTDSILERNSRQAISPSDTDDGTSSFMHRESLRP